MDVIILTFGVVPFVGSIDLPFFQLHFCVDGFSEQIIRINMVVADEEKFPPVVELKTTLSRKHRPDYF